MIEYFTCGFLLYYLESRRPWYVWYSKLRSPSLAPLGPVGAAAVHNNTETDTGGDEDQRSSIKSTVRPTDAFVPPLPAVVRQVLINFVAAMLGFTLLLVLGANTPGFCSDLSRNKSFHETWYAASFKFVMCAVVGETWFYHSHYVMHSRLLYKRFHYLHHIARKPYALVTNYSSLFDVVVTNIPTVFLGPLLLQLSIPLLYVWLTFATVYTELEHSGFKSACYGLFDAPHHHLHHLQRDGNYGLTRFWDVVYGTRLLVEK